ncbi:MAG: molybdopterin-dependent oxidoreductase, partial [Candidatus Bathyarchaeota archaeon]
MVMGNMHEVKRVPFTCTLNCGCRCELIAYVRDGDLVRIDTPARRSDAVFLPRLIPCVKGRALRRSLQAPERVRTPLQRTGPRGSGRFREVTWETALDDVAGWLKRIKAAYGSEAIFHAAGTGSIRGRGFSGAYASSRFFSYWAPVTETFGSMSYHGVVVASHWMMGEVVQASDRATLLDSRLI